MLYLCPLLCVSEFVLNLSTTDNNNESKNLLASGKIDFLNNFLQEMLLLLSVGFKKFQFSCLM
jgi:hypothetical protein